MSGPTPYQVALNWIEKNPGTGGAAGLAKLVLSLWNSEWDASQAILGARARVGARRSRESRKTQSRLRRPRTRD